MAHIHDFYTLYLKKKKKQQQQQPHTKKKKKIQVNSFDSNVFNYSEIQICVKGVKALPLFLGELWWPQLLEFILGCSDKQAITCTCEFRNPDARLACQEFPFSQERQRLIYNIPSPPTASPFSDGLVECSVSL